MGPLTCTHAANRASTIAYSFGPGPVSPAIKWILIANGWTDDLFPVDEALRLLRAERPTPHRAGDEHRSA